MPSPSTTNLPRPKSWDEFEDICTDLLKRIWDDPYIVRNGRTGQRQNGVDCYGLPKRLNDRDVQRYAGAQCKNADIITVEIVREEIEKAKGFKPLLAEYIVMTTAPRDARLQESIRTQTWPFSRVHIMFWEDVSLELSGHEDLLQKHFPDWMKRTTTEKQVLDMIKSSQPEDFTYSDDIGVFFHKSDVLLRIIFDRTERSERYFSEPWATNFPDCDATLQPVYVHYGETRVLEISCACVDGARYIIPFPKSPKNLTLTPFLYHVGRILNHHISGYEFESGLRCAGITVSSDD